MLRKDSGPCAFQGAQEETDVSKELKDIIETTRQAWGLGK